MRKQKDLYRAVCVTFSLALGAYLANAQVTYTCDSTVAASTCNYLNTTTAGHYSGTFSNANATVYIRYGNTGLGSGVGTFNFMTYSQYVAALSANTHRSPVQTAALSALDIFDSGPYGGGDVEITSALGRALGRTGLTGIKSDANTSCPLPSTGCYDAVITITNDPNITLYYMIGADRNQMTRTISIPPWSTKPMKCWVPHPASAPPAASNRHSMAGRASSKR